MKKNKKPTAFRLDPDIAAFLKRAADETGLTQVEIMEACVLKHAKSVAANRMKELALLRDNKALALFSDSISNLLKNAGAD